jgi:methylation protein EvaC
MQNFKRKMTFKFSKCFLTGKKIPIVINFGEMPVANKFHKNQKEKVTYFNMSLSFNKKYSLAQLSNAPSPKKLFNEEYAFLSSTSKNMETHFKMTAQEIKNKFYGKRISILEIGCNDGIFLKNFKNQDHIGIEPAKNVADIAKKNNIKIINKFLNLDTVKNFKLENKFDCIYAANVICHIKDLREIFSSVEKMLKKNGYFIFEDPYFGDILEKGSYDQIYDEHIYYFSITSVQKIARDHGLILVDAKKLKTHGGSMRYYITNNMNKKKTKRFLSIFKSEKRKMFDNITSLYKFKKKIIILKHNFHNKLKKLNKEKKEVYGYGATSKSSTILHFCNINNKLVKGIFDNSRTKINKFSPGKKIKIIDHKKINKFNVKYCILFAWNHYKEIMNKERQKKIIWISHLPNKEFDKKYAKNII